jgi:osmotically inducible protein OsmC
MKRSASAHWEGGLKDGKGTVSTESGVLSNTQYSFSTRFEDGKGTNPEELIGAAHAGCFSMALAAGLGRAGFEPRKVETEARVHLEKGESGFRISRIELKTRAEVPGISPEVFQEQARGAKENCPVSKALAGVAIELDAQLVA